MCCTYHSRARLQSTFASGGGCSVPVHIQASGPRRQPPHALPYPTRACRWTTGCARAARRPATSAGVWSCTTTRRARCDLLVQGSAHLSQHFAPAAVGVACHQIAARYGAACCLDKGRISSCSSGPGRTVSTQVCDGMWRGRDGLARPGSRQRNKGHPPSSGNPSQPCMRQGDQPLKARAPSATQSSPMAGVALAAPGSGRSGWGRLAHGHRAAGDAAAASHGRVPGGAGPRRRVLCDARPRRLAGPVQGMP